MLCTSDHNTALPPLPLCVALTLMLAPLSIVTVVACRSVPLPCQSPPTSTVPPLVAPVALSLAVPVRLMVLAVAVMLPPLPVSELALAVPLTTTFPVAAPAFSSTVPAWAAATTGAGVGATAVIAMVGAAAGVTVEVTAVAGATAGVEVEVAAIGAVTGTAAVGLADTSITPAA